MIGALGGQHVLLPPSTVLNPANASVLHRPHRRKYHCAFESTVAMLTLS